MDKVLIPWENVLIYRDFDRCRRWTMEGGFARMYPLQACVRLAVKLDFITALLKKSLRMYGYRRVPGRAGRSRRSRGLAQYVLGIERFYVF
ncbi:4-hydroxyphenylacetate 3-monooxygenase [Salmonella enterica subsp. enterica]|uniref:4-hydroxyphenylacetate 3-monooxygenase n=1 Tax=Salmonella enterica I TaxID=59201 RepID=A0A379UQD0_SALET|nr:4-hydroxyphenylacetate 3-monooxygenase [Salmonella enterica subsp. enterica]